MTPGSAYLILEVVCGQERPGYISVNTVIIIKKNV